MSRKKLLEILESDNFFTEINKELITEKECASILTILTGESRFKLCAIIQELGYSLNAKKKIAYNKLLFELPIVSTKSEVRSRIRSVRFLGDSYLQTKKYRECLKENLKDLENYGISYELIESFN